MMDIERLDAADAQAAAERAVIEQAREVLSLMPNTANPDVWESTPDGDPCIPWTMHAVTILAIDDLRDAMQALDELTALRDLTRMSEEMGGDDASPEDLAAIRTPVVSKPTDDTTA